MAFAGKWGRGGELPEQKFDYWGRFAEQENYYTVSRKEHLTSYLTGQAEDFIRDQTKLFCLTLSYEAPHVDDNPNNPFIPDTKFAQQYKNITIPRYQQPNDWQSLPEFLQKTEAQLRYDQRFRTDKLYQTSVKNYYRLISGIDESIGRIAQAVNEQNFAQDTYIIFTSDNGFFLGEKELAGKWFGFEPAIRTPLIVSCLNQPQSSPQTVSSMTLNINIAPTVMAIAQVEARPDLIHGVNLVQESTSEPKPREWWFYEHLFEHSQINIPINVGIRSNHQYKYLFFCPYDYEMLFDLEQDPHENVNLGQHSNYKDKIKQYRQLVQESEQKLA